MSQLINKITISVIFILLQACLSFGKTPVDSLNEVLAQKNITLEQKTLTLTYLARAKSITQNREAIRLGNEAVRLSHQLPDTKNTAIAYAILAQIYMQADDITRSATAVDSAVFYAEKTKSYLAKGIAWYRKCWMENLKGDPKAALVSAQQALQYLEKEGNTNFMSAVYYIIASIYANQEDRPLHKKYADLCLKTALVDRDYDNILCAYQTLGTYYQLYHINHPDDLASRDSSLYYNKLALNTYMAHKDQMIIHSTMAIIALNMADTYAQGFPPSYRDTVFHYLDFAQKIGEETHHVEVIANVYGMKSDFETAAGHYEQAENLLLKGLAVVSADSASNLATKVQFMSALASLAETRGNYKEALSYHKQYASLYAQLYDQDKLNITKELEAKYQVEKNATALKNLQQTAILHKRLGYLYIGLGLTLVIAFFFIFRSYHFNLKLASNEAMRLATEQQLLQERQERMQKDLLAGTLQVEQKNVLLKTLQQKIAENKHDKTVLTQINRIIDHDKRLDESLAEDKADFDNVNPEVFEQLKERSNNSLSRLDLKHCAYIYIGLTNKEVSQRLGIAPKSILMARYRIKLKLGLTKEDDLDEYIRSL